MGGDEHRGRGGAELQALDHLFALQQAVQKSGAVAVAAAVARAVAEAVAVATIRTHCHLVLEEGVFAVSPDKFEGERATLLEDDGQQDLGVIDQEPGSSSRSRITHYVGEGAGCRGFERVIGVEEVLAIETEGRETVLQQAIAVLIREQTDGYLNIPVGSLYPALYKLIDAGYISDYKKQVGRRQVNVYYHLEDSGRTHLQQLLEDYYATANAIQQVLKYTVTQ